MTIERNMNIDPDQLNDAARLRALADQEITPEQAGDVVPDDQRVAFERALRESVARVQGSDVRAPRALREAVGAIFERERASSAEAPGPVETSLGDTTDRSFWAGASRYFALAAVLALVVTVIGFGVYSAMGPGAPAAPFALQRASDVRSFVPAAHNYSSGCSPEEFAAKFGSTTIDDAIVYVESHLNGVPEDLRAKLEDLVDHGFRFAGLGACRVPGEGHSVHAMFLPEGEGSPVSVFIQRASTNEVGNFCQRHCFTADCDEEARDDESHLLVWVSSDYIHYVYSSDTEVAALAREAFKAPSLSATLIR